MKKRLLVTAVTIILMNGCMKQKKNDFPILNGPYLGQNPPLEKIELFAPGFVSTGLTENSIAFMPNGEECCWSVLFSGFETILTSRLENSRWTKPELAPFAGKYFDGWPAIQPDGKKMFFHSARPVEDSTLGIIAKYNIWFVERTKDGWGEPKVLGMPVNGSTNATCPSVTIDGTIYVSKRFSDDSEWICRSRFVDGKYQELEVLPSVINASNDNYHAFIAPDESYLIRPLGGREDAIGGVWNYYISFRIGDNEWSPMINLGEAVNSERCQAIPSISSDGKYLFFQNWTPVEYVTELDRTYTLEEMVEKQIRNPSSYSSDLYWIDAKIIEGLRMK